MPLSIEKLETFLNNKGFIPNKYFVLDSYCYYIEILSIKNSEIFLLYIPTKYNFKIKKGNNVYKIEYTDLDFEKDTTDIDYTDNIDENDIEKCYGRYELDINFNDKNDTISSQLENNYKKNIILSNIEKKDSREIKNITKQMNRLRFCIQNIKYKISIMYKNYICSIKRDDTIQCYSIKNYSGVIQNKLYITADLEILYSNIESLVLNIQTIKEEIEHILEKNYFSHIKIIHKLLQEKNDIIKFPDNAYNKKKIYEEYLEESNKMLEDSITSEKNIIDKIYELNETYNTDIKSLNKDIDKIHHLSHLNNELSNIQKVKEDIIKTILDLKIKKYDLILIIDRIMFDNSVMLDLILKNFFNLNKITKN
jgi:hypothetical protein